MDGASSGSGENTRSGSGENTHSGSGENTRSGSSENTRSGSGEKTRSGSGENSTKTNNALDVAPGAGPSGATVHHSGQKVADVTKATPVVTSQAPESADSNAHRHVPAAELSDICVDGGPSREDSPSTQKIAEIQKQTTAQVQYTS